jgi:formate dehydrogenase maturation protein FdhE
MNEQMTECPVCGKERCASLVKQIGNSRLLMCAQCRNGKSGAWAVCNEILNMARNRAGVKLVPASRNPYGRRK